MAVTLAASAVVSRVQAAALSLPDPKFLAINGGAYNRQQLETRIARGLAQRIEDSASREVYKSYRIEVGEFRPGLGRAQVSFFGEATSTFTVDLAGNKILTAVEVRSVLLDQFGTPIGSRAHVISARLTAAGWNTQESDGGPLDEFNGSLTSQSRRALYTLTGLLRHAPGQPAVPWTSESAEQAVRRLFSSLLVFFVPESLIIPVIGDIVAGDVADKLVASIIERFKSKELRWGASEEITEQAAIDNGALFQAFGERVWTDPRGFQTGCNDLPGDWRAAAARVLALHRSCLSNNPPFDSASCAQSQARFAGDVFGVNDFFKPSSPGEMTPDEILDYVSMTSGKWELLGAASDEGVRRRAQDLANAGILVLAIRRGDPSMVTELEKRFTKIVFILPGQMAVSGSWGGNVPNSATLSIGSPSEGASFVNKHLGFSFSNGLNVRLYARRY